MVTQLTLTDVLKKAIQREVESQALYRRLSQKVAEPAVRDAFLDLERQERGHQLRLERYLRGEVHGGLGSRQAIDYRIAEKLDQPDTGPDLALKDVFLLAASREKAAHEFYLGLAKVHPAGEVRELLEDLAAQELEHKRRVEFLFTQVAFPQTDGG